MRAPILSFTMEIFIKLNVVELLDAEEMKNMMKRKNRMGSSHFIRRQAVAMDLTNQYATSDYVLMMTRGH